VKELTENGTMSDQSGPSGLIDIHLSAEISDGSLPSNPQKAIIYHPTVSHLIAVGSFSEIFCPSFKFKFCISVRGMSIWCEIAVVNKLIKMLCGYHLADWLFITWLMFVI
jgi:hypothetical protein